MSEEREAALSFVDPIYSFIINCGGGNVFKIIFAFAVSVCTVFMMKSDGIECIWSAFLFVSPVAVDCAVLFSSVPAVVTSGTFKTVYLIFSGLIIIAAISLLVMLCYSSFNNGVPTVIFNVSVKLLFLNPIGISLITLFDFLKKKRSDEDNNL